MKQVSVHLYSQTEPFQCETEYFFLQAENLNDGRMPFIEICGQMFRKEDIKKIFVKEIPIKNNDEEASQKTEEQ